MKNNIRLLLTLSLCIYANQATCTETLENKDAQATYLARFQAAKKDAQFCHFVNSFVRKSDLYEHPHYELPPQHLDYADLVKKQNDRMREMVSWLRYRSVEKEVERIRTLKTVQEHVRSDLDRLKPVYERCKKLPEQEWGKCIETLKLDLYNLYTNYLRKEQQLFAKT